MNDERENIARKPSQQQAQQPKQTQKPDANPQKQQGKAAQAPKDGDKLGAQPQKRS